MKHLKFKQAFTLVELLVVITIVGILATISAMNYMTALKMARLDGVAGEIVSVIQEQRLKTGAGYGADGNDANNVPLPSWCYGIKVQNEKIYLMSAQIKNQICDMNNVIQGQQLYFESRIKITQPSNITLLFEPPRGEIVSSVVGDEVQIDLVYNGEAQTSIFVRKIVIDLVTGKIEIKK